MSPNSPTYARLNQQWFEQMSGGEFVGGSPHLKHRVLRRLCLGMAAQLFKKMVQQKRLVRVLDMGAGDGVLTLPYLDLGAYVTAVDATPELLDALRAKAVEHQDRLTAIAGDIFAVLERLQRQRAEFDLICASSFLHHIPDYLRLLRLSLGLLARPGFLYTFQDPLRYDSLGRGTYVFDRVAYFCWRAFQGDYGRGIKTRVRRLRGEYRNDLPEDTAEYHVVRRGVDQESIQRVVEAEGLKCEIRSYWSTQSCLFQSLGEALHLKNTFAVVAEKPTR